MTTFKELGSSDPICCVLHSRGISEATPVQEQAIPVVRSGRDVVVQAQTGTGKTLAFLLPILEKIKPQADVAQALIVTPTRELAVQIAKVAAVIGDAVGIRSLVIFGGQDIERQKQKLHRHPQLIIGTPGRLLDHLRRHTLDLSQVNKIVSALLKMLKCCCGPLLQTGSSCCFRRRCRIVSGLCPSDI